MNRKLILGLMAMVLTSPLLATDITWTNRDLIQAPPMAYPVIDASNFVNSGQLLINYTNTENHFDFFPPVLAPDFTTDNTLVYTNENGGLIAVNSGFKFDYWNSHTTAPNKEGPASIFYNDGEIHIGTVDTQNYAIWKASSWLNGNYVGEFTLAGSRCSIWASNVINSGVIDMGFNSLLKVTGDSLDFRHSTLQADTTGFGFGTNFFFNLFLDNGTFDGYWGTGDVRSQFTPPLYPRGIDPAQFFTTPFPQTPTHVVQTRRGTTLFQSLFDENFVGYLDQISDPSGSNILTRVAFVSNTNQDIQANVYFPPFGSIVVEFTNTALAGGLNLYLEDDFDVNTNLNLVVDNIAPYRVVTQHPFDYNLFEFPGGTFFNFGTPATPTDIDSSIYIPGNVTNDWQAWQILFRPVSYVIEDVVGRDYTNGPGRMEFRGSTLDLADAFVSSQNYLLLQATNQYAGNSNALISAPVIDLNLRHTNETFVISNLVAPVVIRFEGDLQLYSARWTNIVAGITNRYHVLFAAAHFTPFAPVRSETAILHTAGSGTEDQIILNDVLTITRNMLIDTARLTIATNESSALTPAGGLHIENLNVVWPQSLPRLQFLTNYGSITASNTIYFAALGNTPYQVFINGGTVADFGSTIAANFFVNSGSVFASGGAISLTGSTAILTNGIFEAASNQISITESALVISNHTLAAGGAISLSASTLLDDGSLNPTGVDSADFVAGRNSWTTLNGFNLLRVPVGNASLLGTAITNIAPPQRVVINRSAAADRGCSAAGFDKNAAIGYMLLDGGDRSVFNFRGVTGNNAIYIDTLELRDYTTNNSNGNFRGLSVSPGMHVYFANAIVGTGENISEKLNGANGGAFCWVSGYNCGPYSSVSLVYPDGSTNRYNAGLVSSTTQDSDGDGLANAVDPTPLPPNGNPCVSAPFPPAGIPIPAIVPIANNGGGTGTGSGSGSSITGGGNGKLGFPTPTGTNNGSATVVKGTFSGLFSDQSNGVTTANSGYFTASTTPAGTFSTKIVMNGKTYSATGAFNAEGKATVKYARGVFKSLTAQLELDSTGSEITGTITDGTWTARLLAERLVFTKKGNTAGGMSGTYTVRIPAQDGSGPQGDGFGTVTIDAGGGVKFSGSLADGSKVSQKTSVSDQGIWPLYSSLYKGVGSLIGWLQVTNGGGLGGEVIWLKSGAFTNDVQASGERYHKPSGHGKVLDLNPCQLILNGGGISITDNNLTLGDNNKLSDAASKLQLNLIPSSGLLKGHILNPDSGKLIQFQGAVFQGSEIGFGYFLNSNQSGQVLLQAAP